MLKKYLKKYQEEPLLVTRPAFDAHKLLIIFVISTILLEFPHKRQLPVKFRIKFTSLIAKSTSPGLSDMTPVAQFNTFA